MIVRKVDWVEKSRGGTVRYKMSSGMKFHSSDLLEMAKAPPRAERRRWWTWWGNQRERSAVTVVVEDCKKGSGARNDKKGKKINGGRKGALM
jgi:hypothetical protein